MNLMFYQFSAFIVNIVTCQKFFCSTKCGQENTVCKRAKEACGVADKCGLPRIYKMLDSGERNEVLELHNTIRSRLALGKDPRYLNITAADMMALSYSPQLEYVAQCWANACEFTHDLCRSTSNYPQVGQNIFVGFDENNILTRAIKQWYTEVNKSDIELVKNFSGDKILEISSFSQIVWAKTMFVGCGRISISQKLFVVCNYFPPGNEIGEKIFTIGKPCTKCKFPRCNGEYDGLCGVIKPISQWRGPYDLQGSYITCNLKLIVLLLILCLRFHHIISTT